MAKTRRATKYCTLVRTWQPRPRLRTGKNEPGDAFALRVLESKRRKIFVVALTNNRVAINAIPLHHLQIPGGIGLMVSSSNPSMQRPNGRMELASKAVTGACPPWATHGRIRGEKRPPRRQIRPTPPRSTRRYQALRWVPLTSSCFTR
jgi:hypothetical protein